MNQSDFIDLDVVEYLPVTLDQFEKLTNEMLVALNKITAPHFLDANNVANLLMSVIHAMDHKTGVANKLDLFDSMVNRISCQLTYAIVEGMRQKLASEQAAAQEAKAAAQETTQGDLIYEGETPIDTGSIIASASF